VDEVEAFALIAASRLALIWDCGRPRPARHRARGSSRAGV